MKHVSSYNRKDISHYIMSSLYVSKGSLHGQRSIQRPKTEGLYPHTSFLVCKGAKKKKKKENVEILYVLPGKESVGTTRLLLLGNAILLTFHDHTA